MSLSNWRASDLARSTFLPVRRLIPLLAMLILLLTNISTKGQCTAFLCFDIWPTIPRFKDWSEQYGEVFSLKIGKGTMIVLNSRRAIHDLIDKRSAIYSSRAHDEQFHIACKGENIAFMDADVGWRAQRKITARFFAPIKLDGNLAKVSEAE